MGSLNIDNITDNLVHFYYDNGIVIKIILAVISSFLLTFTAVPKIIRVSYKKHLMDVPGARSSHVKKIPNLGGIAIFYAISISSSVFAYGLFGEFIFLYSCLVILMFVGLMDDILVVAPDKKLYAQLVVSLMMVLGSGIRIHDFFNILGIEEIPYWISVVFTMLVFLVLINSFNLIDGIDGLASMVGIVAAAAFSYSFYVLKDYNMLILSLSLIASLLAFLYFNLSDRFKIFMGDTGSMIVGFLLIFMAVKFLHLLTVKTPSGVFNYHLPSAPAVVVAILIVPIIDTLTVGFIRIKNKKSPLSADKNHIHHRYLKLNLTHVQASSFIAGGNFVILIITYLLRNLNVNFLMIVVLLLGFLLSSVPYIVQKIKPNTFGK